jgi:hypothetical protein
MTFLKGHEASVNSVSCALVYVIYQFEDPDILTRYTTNIIATICRCQSTGFSSLLKRIQTSCKRSATECTNALDVWQVLAKDEELLYREELYANNLKMAYMVTMVSHMGPAEYWTELNTLQKN